MTSGFRKRTTSEFANITNGEPHPMSSSPQSSFEKRRYIAHVVNLCDMNASLPYALISDFILRRASDVERKFISDFLRHSHVGPHDRINHYEYQWSFREGRSGSLEKDPVKWRYYVIDFPAKDYAPSSNIESRSSRFALAALVSQACLQWTVLSFENPEHDWDALSYNPQLLFASRDYLNQMLDRLKAVPALGSQQLEDVTRSFDALVALTPDESLIVDAIRRFRDSFRLSVWSPFRVLSLFACIEFLVTHDPDRRKSDDSISRQIRSKLPLLSKRFSQPLAPEDAFPACGTRGWEMLYRYRSLIAHGGKIDFKLPSDNGLKELIGHMEILFFLEDFTRRLLRQALNEPVLYLDLKRC